MSANLGASQARYRLYPCCQHSIFPRRSGRLSHHNNATLLENIITLLYLLPHTTPIGLSQILSKIFSTMPYLKNIAYKNITLTIKTGCVSEWCMTVPAAKPDPERVHFQETIRKSSDDLEPLRIRTDNGKLSTWSPPASAFGGLFLSVLKIFQKYKIKVTFKNKNQ